MSSAGDPAAWVDGDAVPAADVAAEVHRLRRGPAGARLPREGTADGRQLRRWVAQRVVVRRLLERECAARGLDPAGAPPLRPDPALLGTAAADVLATSAAGRAVFAAVTTDVRVTEDQLRAQHEEDRPVRPERWSVREAFSTEAPPTALPSAPRVVHPATLLPEVRAAAGPAPTVVRSTLGWHLVAVDAVLPAGPVPFADARAELAATLADRHRQAAFARWLDAAVAARVRLATGFEHPADPRQPDATHRH